jgi:hypothetical protein
LIVNTDTTALPKVRIICARKMPMTISPILNYNRDFF